MKQVDALPEEGEQRLRELTQDELEIVSGGMWVADVTAAALRAGHNELSSSG